MSMTPQALPCSYDQLCAKLCHATATTFALSCCALNAFADFTECNPTTSGCSEGVKVTPNRARDRDPELLGMDRQRAPAAHCLAAGGNLRARTEQGVQGRSGQILTELGSLMAPSQLTPLLDTRAVLGVLGLLAVAKLWHGSPWLISRVDSGGRYYQAIGERVLACTHHANGISVMHAQQVTDPFQAMGQWDHGGGGGLDSRVTQPHEGCKAGH